MEISTYSFSGDFTTFLGLVGIISAFIVVSTAFRSYWRSPYNVRYVTPDKETTQTSNDNETPVT